MLVNVIRNRLARMIEGTVHPSAGQLTFILMSMML